MLKNFPFEYRIGQREIIDEIISLYGKNDVVVLESPTGTGKSVIAYTAALEIFDRIGNFNYDPQYRYIKKMGPPILFLTKTKALQKQYVENLPFPSISSIWTKEDSIYRCPKYNIEEDGIEVYHGDYLCQGDSCEIIDDCPYLKAQENFHKSKIGVTNYYYYILSRMNPKVLICDEAHNLETVLYDVASVEIKFEQLNKTVRNLFFNPKERYLTIGLKKLREVLNKKSEEELENSEILFREFRYFREYLKEQYSLCLKKLKTISSKEEKEKDHRDLRIGKALNRLTKNLLSLNDKLNLIDEMNLTHYVVTKNSDADLSVKPLVIKRGFQKIRRNSNFTILMSATIGGETAFKSLGLNEKEMYYINAPSNIPIENRPVFIEKKYNFNFKNRETVLPIMVQSVDEILEKVIISGELQVNGIIHSASYQNAEYLLENSKYKDYMMIPRGDELRNLREFLKEKKIIISPSILEGIDFPGDLSELQIFLKVPFRSLSDRWTKKKVELDSEWYLIDAARRVVQGSGRSIRSPEDKAITFILDKNVSRLIKYFPIWFREALFIKETGE